MRRIDIERATVEGDTPPVEWKLRHTTPGLTSPEKEYHRGEGATPFACVEKVAFAFFSLQNLMLGGHRYIRTHAPPHMSLLPVHAT